MIQTYKSLYDKYQALYGDDTCIFLLVGKFYELYDVINPQTESPYTSILRAARIMNIQVTKKEDGSFFAGIPEQSRDKFAQTLTSRGWTVVIVDQVKNSANKVIDRITARILSPGTHVEMAGQERMSVASVYFCPGNTGFATSVNDLTTGEVFSLQTNEADSILHMFQIYNVSEVVAVTGLTAESVKGMFGLQGKGKGQVHCFEDTDESSHMREEFFRKMFKVKSLMPMKTLLSISTQSIEKSLLFLLRYIEDHFPHQTERLTSHTIYNPSTYMRLSNNIIEQLNIITKKHTSVLDIIDHTFSSIGKRALRERILRPITDGADLEKRWNQVEWATTLETPVKRLIERDLKGIYDIPRLHFKVACGNLNATDILQLFQSYGATFCLLENLLNTPIQCENKLMSKIHFYRTHFTQIFEEGKAVKRSNGSVIGFLTKEAGPKTHLIELEIDSIWAEFRANLHEIAGTFSDQLSIEKTTSGYSLEAPRNLYSFLKKKEEFQITLKKSGPIELETKEFTRFCQRIFIAEGKLERVLKEEYIPHCDMLWDILKDFQDEWVHWIGTIDCSLSLGTTAQKLQWCKPSLGDGLRLEGLRHPILENSNSRVEYIKHSIELHSDVNGWLLYGVNASGKSSLMKATGIAVILSQAGSFVPATSMSVRPYDAAFSRIWTHDNIWAGLSSFAVEITELSEILTLATEKSLVLGDEVCSGTESSSATALVGATIETLQKRGAHFMFATHLHDLLKIPGLFLKGISVWHLRVITMPDGKLIYDRSLQPGSGSSTYGLEVAKAMGLPFSVIQRAHEIRRCVEGISTVQDAPKSSYNSLIQRHMCEVCKCQIVNELEVHHIEEQANGGSNAARNLVVLCSSCHHKHHNKEIEVPPLTQTSHGFERFIHTRTAPSKDCVKEDSLTIKRVIEENRSRPLQRILTILQEGYDIRLTLAQLRKFL